MFLLTHNRSKDTPVKTSSNGQNSKNKFYNPFLSDNVFFLITLLQKDLKSLKLTGLDLKKATQTLEKLFFGNFCSFKELFHLKETTKEIKKKFKNTTWTFNEVQSFDVEATAFYVEYRLQSFEFQKYANPFLSFVTLNDNFQQRFTGPILTFGVIDSITKCFIEGTFPERKYRKETENFLYSVANLNEVTPDKKKLSFSTEVVASAFLQFFADFSSESDLKYTILRR